MAAARSHLADGADGADDPDGDGPPPLFRQALASLSGAHVRPEVRLQTMPAPRRLAPWAHALEGAVVVDGTELADGRFVLLHDPAGQDAWQGTFRVVTLTRAELEPEMTADPLLPEVTWSWLTGALGARSAEYGEPSGTVTHAGSHYFGRLAEREPESRVEIRASWTPSGPDATDPAAHLAAHLAAWGDLLCQCAGLPPESAENAEGSTIGTASGGTASPDAGSTANRIVPLPQRRGPQQP